MLLANPDGVRGHGEENPQNPFDPVVETPQDNRVAGMTVANASAGARHARLAMQEARKSKAEHEARPRAKLPARVVSDSVRKNARHAHHRSQVCRELLRFKEAKKMSRRLRRQ